MPAAWTTPRTWVASEVVTASIMNTHIRDNELLLKTPYSDLGRIPALSSTYVHDLSATSLTGLVQLGSNNAFVGKQKFAAAYLCVPVGADKWTGTKGVDA
jgi:hypothetical protein